MGLTKAERARNEAAMHGRADTYKAFLKKKDLDEADEIEALGLLLDAKWEPKSRRFIKTEVDKLVYFNRQGSRLEFETQDKLWDWGRYGT